MKGIEGERERGREGERERERGEGGEGGREGVREEEREDGSVNSSGVAHGSGGSQVAVYCSALQCVLQ